MGQILLDHHCIFDAGNHSYGASALTATLNIDIEHPFEALRSDH
jgi:hypothetical protein